MDVYNCREAMACRLKGSKRRPPVDLFQDAKKSVGKKASAFLLARPSQDVFLLPLIPWIEQEGSSLLLDTLLFDLFDVLTI